MVLPHYDALTSCQTITGNQIKKELNACSVGHDLPKGNELREKLMARKGELEKLMDKLFG